jgi:hypothetical protein
VEKLGAGSKAEGVEAAGWTAQARGQGPVSGCPSRSDTGGARGPKFGKPHRDDSTRPGTAGQLSRLAGPSVKHVVATVNAHPHTLVQGDGAVDVLGIHAEPDLRTTPARKFGERATKERLS